MKSFSAAIYCTLFFGFLSAQVQYHEQAGNLPLNSVRNLMILSTKNFEIAYDAQYEPLAKLTAQYAEAAYFDLSLSKNWDSRLKTKARINLFPNFWEYQAHFTSFQPGLYKNNVTFGHHRNVGFAYFTGDRASFYAQIRYLISKFLIYDQLLGKSNLNFQNNLLLYLPDWFVEGAAYFMSEGWNEKDEVLMKQIQPNQWEELLMKPSNALTIKTLRKSFWYFIAKEWKKEKINEIFYMTRLTRSIEGGLLTVLGQTHKTIMTRWIAFCETFYTFDSNFPQPIFQLKKNQRILGWDANDKLIVGLIEQNAFVYPFVYEIQSQKFNLFTTKKLHMYLLPDFELQLPVKMNSKGTFFIFPDFKKSVQLFKFDLQNYKIENLTTDKNLDGFNQFYPFPNSDDFVISAYQQGNSDLWLLKANGKLEQLTKTPYIDELYPVVYDENTIFTAASLVDTSQKTFALLDVQNAKSLLKLHLDTKKTDVVLTAHEYTYIPVARLNQFLVLKNSNTFPTQLMALQFPQKNFIYITNSPYGIYEVVVHENKSFQSFFLRSQYVITELNLPMDTLKTPKLSDKRTFSLSNLWQEELKQRKSYQHLEEVLQHDTTEINEIPTEDKNKVKYYVFDEGDTVKVISKQKKRKSKKEHVKYDELFFNLERVQMKDIEKHALTPIITKVNITFDLDPIYRLGIKNELFLKDSRNRKELRLMFTPYLKDFHSSFHQIEYKQRWSKYQWNLNFYKQSNFFKDPFFIRYNHATLSSGITRFFSIYDQLKFEIQATRIARYDLRLIDNRALNGKTWNNQLVLRYEFKKLETHQNYIYQGNHLIFNNLTAYPWRDKNYSFTNFELDYRNYFALGHIVFASRIRGAFSLGRVRPHYFLGGWEQWLNAEFLNKKELPVGSSLERFYYTRVVPLKGFAYNARNGTQFLMVSSEMRIPTSRILKRPTSGVPLYNFQWIIFGEIGTAWTTGNPFSQKNPIDAKTIERPPLTITVQSLKSPFIASIGMGVKFNVLGFPIRFDVAAPIEDSSFTPTKLGLFLAYEF